MPRAIDAVTATPTCRSDASVDEARSSIETHAGCVVVNESDVVLGVLHRSDLDGDQPVLEAMHPGPTTFRPGVAATELAKYLRKHRLEQALLTTAEGRLVGIATRRMLESLAAPPGGTSEK